MNNYLGINRPVQISLNFIYNIFHFALKFCLMKITLKMLTSKQVSKKRRKIIIIISLRSLKKFCFYYYFCLQSFHLNTLILFIDDIFSLFFVSKSIILSQLTACQVDPAVSSDFSSSNTSFKPYRDK